MNPQTDSAMGRAFANAGYILPADALMEAARDAVRASPCSSDGARDALFRTVRGDAMLLWKMFAAYRTDAADKLLRQANMELRELERPVPTVVPSARGHSGYDNQPRCAPRANTPSSDGLGLNSYESQRYTAQPVRSTPRRPQQALAEVQAAMRHVAEVTRLSLLDTIRIDGQPLGDLTPNQALTHARKQAGMARFLRLLCANLPPNTPIKAHRAADDTQAIYEQAMRETCNAE